MPPRPVRRAASEARSPSPPGGRGGREDARMMSSPRPLAHDDGDPLSRRGPVREHGKNHGGVGMAVKVRGAIPKSNVVYLWSRLESRYSEGASAATGDCPKETCGWRRT